MGISEKEATELVGLIPAGGRSSRVSPLPCSKEIFPVGFGSLGKNGNLRPKVAAQYLLESMHIAGTKKVFVILRRGKWDIPAYFGNGSLVNMPIGYLMVDLPYGVPYTLDSALSFIEDKQVVFGFPDIIFEPKDAFAQLVKRQLASRADLVLGLFPATNSKKTDMVDLDDSGKVRAIQIKPTQTELKYTWIVAVWNDSFTRFMHYFVTQDQEKRLDAGMDQHISSINEIFVGDVIQSALSSDLKIDNVIFSKGSYIDIGTPEDMLRAAKVHMPL